MQSTTYNPLIEIKNNLPEVLHTTEKGETLTIHGINIATEDEEKAIISTLSNNEIMQYYKSGILDKETSKNRIDLWQKIFNQEEPKLLHLLIKKDSEYIGKIGLCYENNSRVQIWFLTNQQIDSDTMREIGILVQQLLLPIKVGVYGTYHPDNKTEGSLFKSIGLELITQESQRVRDTGLRYIVANAEMDTKKLLEDKIDQEAIKSFNAPEESKEESKTWLQTMQAYKDMPQCSLNK